jgi:hypothetical protein
MRELLCVVLVTVVVAAAMLFGCVPGLKSSKTGISPQDSPAGPNTSDQSVAKTDPSRSPGKDLENFLPPPPPSYKSGEQARGLDDRVEIPELRQKDEVNEAALKFAKEVPDVKHVKTCFSRVYGGWYLLLYIEKGKKISLQQYSWNPKSREWEVVYHIKEVPQNQMEFHLKGEVGDEKCFVLKK